ncbi:hypothetical protein RND81_14G025200 [Saponaria officinalis]|uniref:Peptidase A1 domain-containing protein n=1 Tax=Saponaria officinalis TaxID=3572 RepID=A0AAW1GKK1_SAPOF
MENSISPLYIKNQTRQERLNQLLEHSINRARSISSSQSRSNDSVRPERIPQQELSVRAAGGTMVLMKVGVGTFQTPIPYKTYYFIFDTGCEQIWLQCENCVNPPNKCFGEPPITFPNSKSTTYHQIPCGTHELCYTTHDKDGNCIYQCKDDFCSYDIEYADDSKIEGYLASEMFTLDASPSQNDINQDNVFNLIVGCNFSYEGEEVSTPEIGILGIGWGPRSFIDQTKTQLGDSFSYCFPSYEETLSGAQGYVNLGSDDEFDPKDFKAISLIEYDGYDSYYLNLNGIRFAGKRLPIDPFIFVRRNDKGGTVIDSGASFSYLIEEAYDELKKELIRYFEQRDFTRVNPGPDELQLDLCYKTLGHKSINEFPSVALIFDRVDFLLRPEHVYVWISDPSNTVCLNIMPFEGASILGAFQQSNFHFVFDRQKSLLYFKSENCKLGV